MIQTNPERGETRAERECWERESGLRDGEWAINRNPSHLEGSLERKFPTRASNGNLEFTLRDHPSLLDDVPDCEILVAKSEGDGLGFARLKERFRESTKIANRHLVGSRVRESEIKLHVDPSQPKLLADTERGVERTWATSAPATLPEFLTTAVTVAAML